MPMTGIPSELFTDQTFKTLGECVAVAGVVATVLSGVFDLDAKWVGLIVLPESHTRH